MGYRVGSAPLVRNYSTRLRKDSHHGLVVKPSSSRAWIELTPETPYLLLCNVNILRPDGVHTLRLYLHGIKGDPAQLGGDFIVGGDGLILLAHPSHDPTDRPTAGELLARLDKSRKTGPLLNKV